MNDFVLWLHAKKMEQRATTYIIILFKPKLFHERDYVNSSYRNYEEDNTVFVTNVEPLW
jgi:hypothetical protein